jgi:cation diffusion facilitator CzcD-associated flavoprotein CzcO
MSRTKYIIVGAGFGGIEMAVALKRAGIDDFVILEKSDDVGGVWRDNSYPGCSCDVPSHLYSFSFAPYKGRNKRFPPQKEILAYLRQVADSFGLIPHLRLNTPVSQAVYQESERRWRLTTAAGELFDAESVIFAVGQLHRPSFPDIPGRQDFKGYSLHPAVWDHDIDLRGKRIAIIGTGSSAAQMLPVIASAAKSVSIYQRSPAWILPKPNINFGLLSRSALRLPGAHGVYRKSLYYGADVFLAPVVRSKLLGWLAEGIGRRHLRLQVQNEDLRLKLSPTYSIGSKRILFDSNFYPTLANENVRLVTEPITQITPTGIVTANGEHTPVDIIIYATGFKASEFLVPMSVLGRDGRSLNKDWAAGAEAFMGLAVPGYPNAFIIAGPNTFNPAGSNPNMKEVQVAYIMRCLYWKKETGAETVEVSEEAMAEYRAWLDRKMKQTIWPTSVDSWYKHESGKITNPWPASARDFARMLRRHPKECFQIDVGVTAEQRLGLEM